MKKMIEDFGDYTPLTLVEAIIAALILTQIIPKAISIVLKLFKITLFLHH
jgi:hypothetical protein